jgi:hypothetical protein
VDDDGSILDMIQSRLTVSETKIAALEHSDADLRERLTIVEKSNADLQEKNIELQQRNTYLQESMDEIDASLQSTMLGTLEVRTLSCLDLILFFVANPFNYQDSDAINDMRLRILVNMGRDNLAVVFGHKNWQEWRASASSREELYNSALARLKEDPTGVPPQWANMGNNPSALRTMLFPKRPVQSARDSASELGEPTDNP